MVSDISKYWPVTSNSNKGDRHLNLYSAAQYKLLPKRMKYVRVDILPTGQISSHFYLLGNIM